MAAGDRADAIGHGDNGETERAGDAEQVDGGRARSHAADDRRPDAEEHQGESADKFSRLLVHCPLHPASDSLKAPYSHHSTMRKGSGRAALSASSSMGE